MNYEKDCQNAFPSLWSVTARERDVSVPMQGEHRCDVVVIGAGYTGLVAGLELARAGTDVIVIDGGAPGWGASGRNSGAVVRGFKNSRSRLIAEFGPERGRIMADFGATNSEVVYDLIGRYGIDCDLKRTGWVLAAHNRAGLARTAERQKTWSADGIAGLEMVSRADMAGMLGSGAYIGGMIDREGASLNPLSYARGLARGAVQEGAKVFSGTRAVATRRLPREWEVTTSRGTIRARAVVVATDAYTAGLVPSVKRSLATVHTNIICTDILPRDIASTILPAEPAVSDVRRILFYWHKDPQGRVLFGTRGQLAGPTSPGSFAHVEAAMLSVYPQLRGQPIAFRWAGRVGLTRDFMPHVDQPQPDLWTSHGYCGRGVAMASAYGALIARTMLAGGAQADLPVPNDPAPKLPPSPFKELGVYATTQACRLLDRIN